MSSRRRTAEHRTRGVRGPDIFLPDAGDSVGGLASGKTLAIAARPSAAFAEADRTPNRPGRSIRYENGFLCVVGKRS